MSDVVILLPGDFDETNEKFEVTRKQASECNLIKSMLEEDDGQEVPEIPLHEVQTSMMEKLIEFLKHHENDPVKIPELPLAPKVTMEELFDVWDVAFLTSQIYNGKVLNYDKFLKWYHMANYIDHPGLFCLLVSKMSITVANQEPEENYEMLGIQEPEFDEAKMHRDDPNNQWLFELTEKAEREIEKKKVASVVIHGPVVTVEEAGFQEDAANETDPEE